MRAAFKRDWLTNQVLIALLISCLFCTTVSAVQLPSQSTDKNQLKSLFLYRLPKLIKWQNSSKAGAVFFRYCILDAPKFSSALSALVSGKKIARKIIEVVAFDEKNSRQNCHIVFVGTASSINTQPSSQALIKNLINKGVLLVGNHPSFIAAGGQINLANHYNKLIFEINKSVLQNTKLRINSRLLDFANIVTPEREGR
ncbi:MAG: YfiR family protein [Kordiimonadaceae bacterium]|nr:YfiR family protein [Kordiimonadaceae bacterium]